MTRIRQTLLLWWRLWREGRPGYIRKRPDGSESVDLTTLRRVARFHPVNQAVNLLLWHAWLSGQHEWSISPAGPSLDFRRIRRTEADRMAANVRALAAGDPLLTGSNVPAAFDRETVAAWLSDVDHRTPAQQGEVGVAVHRCRGLLETYDLIDDLEARAGRLWPRIQVRLWQMSNGADGHPRWFLPPRRSTCHGRLVLLIRGSPLTVHLTYAPSRIDVRMVPDSPAATAPTAATTSA